jgi:hypothetical protein
MTIPPALERAVLQMVRNGGGQASWHRLATWLPSFDVPLTPDLMVVLKDLKARGLVTQTLVGGGMDRWAITAAGEALLGGRPPPGPLAPDELARFTEGVRGGLDATLAALRPFASDGLKLWAVLRQMLAANVADALVVAEVGLFLPPSERGPFARELLDDPRPEVREALFRAWTPVRQDVPGKPLPTVPDDELDELLRRGLTDASPAVREAAAVLAFLAVRGASLVGELIVNLGAADPGLRWWSILALGGAADPLTHELLAELVKGDDLAEASAAVRALGQRPDGHAAWLAGLDDPRPDVHNAAAFALATVVTDLTEDELAAVAAHPREPVAQALAAYRVRAGKN